MKTVLQLRVQLQLYSAPLLWRRMATWRAFQTWKGTDWSLGNAAWVEGSVICVDALTLIGRE